MLRRYFNKNLTYIFLYHPFSYLLVSFLLAELSSHGSIIDNRLESLQSALIYWQRFLERIEHYKIMSPIFDRQMFEQLKNIKSCEPELKRQMKISVYQNLKRTSETVNGLFDKIMQQTKQLTPFTSSSAIDEETERELYITLLQKSVCETFEHEFIVEMELDLLQNSKMNEVQPAAAPPKLKHFIIEAKDPSTLRNQYLKRVFQPYCELPSITLEEVARWEMQLDVNILSKDIQKDQGYKKKNCLSEDEPTDDSDNSEKEDNVRKWDDWKDEHPRGSGNKMYNRG